MPNVNERLRALAALLPRPSVDREVDAELAFHVEMMTAQLVQAGLTPADARAEAIRRFGDMRSVTMQCEHLGRQRDRRRTRAEYLAELWSDMSFAMRQLSRARGFTVSAAL